MPATVVGWNIAAFSRYVRVVAFIRVARTSAWLSIWSKQTAAPASNATGMIGHLFAGLARVTTRR